MFLERGRRQLLQALPLFVCESEGDFANSSVKKCIVVYQVSQKLGLIYWESYL